MRKFEFLDHTGDLGIRAFGNSLTELFRHAAEALFDVITDPETIRSAEARKIAIEANGLDELMVNWLNEFIYLFDTQGLLFHDFDFLSLTEQALEATVRGEPYDESRHPIKTTVKSATYHQLQIRQVKGIWEAQVILDL
jgi:SHS2 domain-containing protein